ncbi:MAG: aminoacyl-tRNA hydrolase [bacterium]
MVGLGNPGRRYARTRHNVGFRVADALVTSTRAAAAAGGTARFLYDAWRSENPPVVIAKPQTFMNASGNAVRALLDEWGVGAASVLVVADDVNLPLGRVRVRGGGSGGGHNGLRSIIDQLGTVEFPRLRLGVGPRPPEVVLSDFVLGDFAADEEESAEALVARGALAAIAFAERGLEAAMREFNASESEIENEGG